MRQMRLLGWRVWWLIGLCCAVAGAEEVPTLLLLDGGDQLAALSVAGESQVIVQQGDVVVNSRHNSAIFASNAKLEVQQGRLLAVGGSQTLGTGTISPAVEKGAAGENPYLGLTIPNKAKTRSQKRLFVPKGEHQLSPGLYIGGILTSDEAKITFAPGVYLIANGDLAFNGCEAVGEGVTFVVGGPQPGKVMFGNEADVTLTAPTEGDFAGLALISFGDEQAVGFNGSKAHITGTIYAPKAKIGVHFKSEVSASRIVAHQLVTNTSAVLNLLGEAVDED